jgi:hypothetical protein
VSVLEIDAAAGSANRFVPTAVPAVLVTPERASSTVTRIEG